MRGARKTTKAIGDLSRLVSSRLRPGLVNLRELHSFNFSTHGVCHIQHARNGSSRPFLCEMSLSLGDLLSLTSHFSSQTALPTASRLSVLLVVLVLSFVFPLIFRRNIVDKDGHPIPPGPPLRYAFLRRYPERALHVWARTYGPLLSVWMGNQLFVVISDARIAKDLMVSNGAIFSGRKKYFMKNQTILRGRAITATSYGETW
jgi:Cytochrome P450